MKLFTIAILSTLLSISAFANGTNILKAVLDNPEVQSLTFIKKLEVTKQLKCPSCYEVEVTSEEDFLGQVKEVILILETQGTLFSDNVVSKVIGKTK